MLALVAQAGSQAVQKSMVARAEAQDIEDAMLRGEGNLNGQLSRIHFLGQEAVVAFDLSDAMHRQVDPAVLRIISQALATLAHPNGEQALLHLLGSDDGPTRM